MAKKIKKIDVIIPLGPTKAEIEKMAPLTFYIPKPLILLGTRPLLWHVFNQLQEIEARIVKIHLLIRRIEGDETWKILQKCFDTFQLNIAGITDKTELIVSEKSTVEMIGDLSISSDHFLMHYPDILLRPPNKRFLTNLLNVHSAQQERVMGTLVHSLEHPLNIGVVFTDRNDLVTAFQEKAAKRQWGRMQINVAISVFNKTFQAQLNDPLLNAHIQSDNFYGGVSQLIEKGGVKLASLCYLGKWWHVDTLPDLRRFRKLI